MEERLAKENKKIEVFMKLFFSYFILSNLALSFIYKIVKFDIPVSQCRRRFIL